MKKIIGCLLLQFFLIIMFSYAQYTTKPYKNVISSSNALSLIKDGKKMDLPLIILYKCNKILTLEEAELEEELKLKKGGGISDDLLDVVLKNIEWSSIGQLQFYYPVIKIDKARSHYLLYFLKNEFPAWKGPVTIKSLEDYIKIKVMKENISDVTLMSAHYHI